MGGSALEVRRLTAHDAPGLAACLDRCYGDAYPKRVLYRPHETAALIDAGTYAGVVAVAGTEIVGHIGYSRPTPNATVAEAGTTIVDKRHRGGGLMGRMAQQLGLAILSEGVEGVIQFPTTAHTVMQRAATVGGHETGVLLAYIPRSTRRDAAGGRVAVTVVYQAAVTGAGQRVFVPERYRDRVRELAAAAGLERELLTPDAAASGPSELHQTFDEARSLARLSVRRAGEDFGGAPADPVAGTQAALLHVDLAMDDPGIGSAVETLRSQRFAYGAWLPGWNGHDVLRMQRVEDPTADELHPDLYTTQAQALCASIREELAGEV